MIIQRRFFHRLTLQAMETSKVATFARKAEGSQTVKVYTEERNQVKRITNTKKAITKRELSA